jgi:hypothetical protein
MSGNRPGYPPISEINPDDVEHRRQIVRAINDILQGKLNATNSITLTANSATTTLTDARISANSYIGFQPTTANGAAALGGLYVSAQQKGSATLTHTNNAQTDKSFKILIIG